MNNTTSIDVWLLTTTEGGDQTCAYGTQEEAESVLREIFNAPASVSGYELEDFIISRGHWYQLERQEISIPKAAPKPGLHRWMSRNEVLDALSRACDDITEAANLPDTGITDALTLMLNAADDYLFAPGVGNLEQVVANNYDIGLEELTELIKSQPGRPAWLVEININDGEYGWMSAYSTFQQARHALDQKLAQFVGNVTAAHYGQTATSTSLCNDPDPDLLDGVKINWGINKVIVN